MSNYVIELSVIHVTLILGYWLFLRKEQQYAKMRFYLISSTLLALTIPLLKLPKLLFNGHGAITSVPMEAIPLDILSITPTADGPIWKQDLLIIIYGAVSVFFLLKFLANVSYLIYLERKSTYEIFNGLYIRRVPNITGSCTFFNWIFLSNDIDTNRRDYEVILQHEKAHASLGHTYDLMFFELFRVCLWWLPTSWFIIKEIKAIHEYQADACALQSFPIDRYSSVLIGSVLKLNGLSLASSFHDGFILKRLTAMKQKVKKVSRWKLAALGSLCVILFVAFACSEDLDPKTKEIDSQGPSKTEGEVFTIVEELPQYPGGIDALYEYVVGEIKYPIEARTSGVEGIIDVQFVVEKDGSLSDVKAINGIGAGCDAEAVRVLQNAQPFQPGHQGGKAVRVRMVMPIVFKIHESKTNADDSPQGIIHLKDVQTKNGKFTVDASYANGEWSGTVYDEEGEGLPGVNIVVAGTTTGTVSDLDGTFKVKAIESNDLYLSFVGYESVRLGGK